MTAQNQTQDGRNPGSNGTIQPPRGTQTTQRNLTPTYPSQSTMGTNKYSGLRSYSTQKTAPQNQFSPTQNQRTGGRTFNIGQDSQGQTRAAQDPTTTGEYAIPSSSLDNYSQGVRDVINDPTKGQDVAPVLSSNIAHFLDSSNPIMKAIEQNAIGQANRRGLANSSIAIQSSQQAILERASQLGLDATTMGNENWARNLGLSIGATDTQFNNATQTSELFLERQRIANETYLAESTWNLNDARTQEIIANMELNEKTFQLDRDKWLESIRQWDAEFGQKYTEFLEGKRQFDADLSLRTQEYLEGQRQFNENEKRLWNEFLRKHELDERTLTLDESKHAEVARQFNEEMKRKDAELAEKVRQFDDTEKRLLKEFMEGQRQFNKEDALKWADMTRKYDLSEDQLQLKRDEFEEKKAQWWEEFDKRYDLMSKELGLKAAEIESRWPRDKDGNIIDQKKQEDYRKAIAQAFTTYRQGIAQILSDPKQPWTDRVPVLQQALLKEINYWRGYIGEKAITAKDMKHLFGSTSTSLNSTGSQAQSIYDAAADKISSDPTSFNTNFDLGAFIDSLSDDDDDEEDDE